MTTERGNAPAARTGAFQDTRAEKSWHPKDTTLATVGASVINWTTQAVSPLARGRPPDAEPLDEPPSSGSPGSSSSATSSGLGDASILQQDAGPVYPSVYSGHSTVRAGMPRVTTRPSKRERERAAYLATARVRRIGPGHYEAESGSRPGAWHTCLLVRGHLSCSCPATGPCRHLVLCTPLLLADARLLEGENREAAVPSLLGPERLAAARLAASYDEGEPLWGGAS